MTGVTNETKTVCPEEILGSSSDDFSATDAISLLAGFSDEPPKPVAEPVKANSSRLPLVSRRVVEMRGITFPIRVEHAHLDSSVRIDTRQSRIDMLDLHLIVHSSYGPLNPQTLQGVWNYASIYKMLCEPEVPTITGPLEGVLDAVLDQVFLSGAQQEVTIYYAEIVARRKGLAVGSPVLKRSKGAEYGFLSKAGDQRSVGFSDYPLNVSFDHSWCDPTTEQVEHRDVRSETVLVSFSAVFGAQPLSESNLSGLLNYVSTVEMLDRLQGSKICDASEHVVDIVRAAVEEEAKKEGVGLQTLSVRIQRRGYARFTPVLGVDLVY